MLLDQVGQVPQRRDRDYLGQIEADPVPAGDLCREAGRAERSHPEVEQPASFGVDGPSKPA